jgi:ketosteroid isomerase-like protein
MRRSFATLVIAATFAAAATAHAQQPANADLKQQVMATERAFAKTMADRDFTAFTSFLSDEAIFFSETTPLRGKAAISAAWKSFYNDKPAPFSWAPETVEVLDSGTLALSSGPVRDPNGKVIATFQSIWRLERPGTWHIVFDKGSTACTCAKPQ